MDELLAREGDLIKNKSGVVFDVKGLLHPPNKVIAFPRFIPSPLGIRRFGGVTYGKVYSLDERFKYLREKHPDLIVFDQVFGETLCEVPIEQISHHYQPSRKLTQLRRAKRSNELEAKALKLVSKLKEKADVAWNSLGVSGSIMVGLSTSTSDIDPLVYGVENSRRVYAALQELLSHPDSGFKPYSPVELKTLYDFRLKDTQMAFEDFQLVESRKAFQGMFMGTDYFVRFIKDWQELTEQYGDVYYQNYGYIRITAEVDDASDALFTPCTYRLKKVVVFDGPSLSPISEVVSFRGRFCMQALKGEKIIAQGKAELVTNQKTGETHYRLILGNKPSDFMVLVR